jgi:epoxide hydrolase-like predicted phosphatase
MSETGPIEAIIFDYGGVISSPLFRGIGEFEAASGYPPGSLLRLLFGEVHYVGVEGRAVADALDDGSNDAGPAAVGPDPLADHDWHRLERGEIDFSAYFGGLQARAPEILGVDLDIDAYGRFMGSTAIGVHWPVVHRIRDLKVEGFQLALLTNNIAEFGDHWKATFPLDDLFEIVVDSSSVGMRKPDPAIYLLTLDQLRVPPTASVFVDDNADNIRAARELGMETVHFGDDPWDALAELDQILARRAG